MILEYDINAYEMNQVTLYTVQGEADSRTVIFNIIEKSGVQIPTSNATVINKMLDLAEYTARFYVIRSDERIVFCDGTIIDAQNGQVSFKLTKNCTEVQGIYDCAIVLTKGSEDLRVVGISLQVAACNIGKTTSTVGREGTQEALCSANMQVQNISVVETKYEEVQNA